MVAYYGPDASRATKVAVGIVSGEGRDVDPLEEGVDYPEGQTCPSCPYWANRDRWTGEVVPSA